MRIDAAFAGDYELGAPDRAPAAAAVAYEFPPGARTEADPAAPGRTEMTITWSVGGAEVQSDPMPAPEPVRLDVSPAAGARWLGIFHAQLPSPRGASCAVALPDRESVAVLSHGAAYRVWAGDPGRWEELSPGGVMAPLVVRSLELVLLIEHTSIVAYGANGLAWRSDDLVWDDLEAVGIDGGYLHATGFDAARDAIVAPTVDLRTGQSPDAPRHTIDYIDHKGPKVSLFERNPALP